MSLGDRRGSLGHRVFARDIQLDTLDTVVTVCFEGADGIFSFGKGATPYHGMDSVDILSQELSGAFETETCVATGDQCDFFG